MPTPTLTVAAPPAVSMSITEPRPLDPPAVTVYVMLAPWHKVIPLGDTLAAMVPSAVAVIVSNTPHALSDATKVMVPVLFAGNCNVFGVTVIEPAVTNTSTVAVPLWSSLTTTPQLPGPEGVTVNVVDAVPELGLTLAIDVHELWTMLKFPL